MDISDAATGRLITERDFPWDGPKIPEYYMAYSYFHGALHVSPNGRWIADDGWVWGPVAIPMVWDLHQWLQNAYESEYGPSRRRLAQRSEWNQSMCWLGDRLVISGLGGNSDYPLVPGVRIFNPEAGTEENAFAGPAGELTAVGRLLLASTADGVTAWDADTGERTDQVHGVTANRHHPGSGEFVTLDHDTAHVWSLIGPRPS